VLFEVAQDVYVNRSEQRRDSSTLALDHSRIGN
jgi:hypothetical protein